MGALNQLHGFCYIGHAKVSHAYSNEVGYAWDLCHIRSFKETALCRVVGSFVISRSWIM